MVARVCAEHFDEVVVIDPDADALVARARRDDAYTRPGSRPRVMQAEAYHTTTGLYYAGLGRLFPDLDAELAVAGAPCVASWSHASACG
jgi:hypothetical protein